MMDIERLHAQNRRSWNAVVPAHNSHRANQVAFLRQGGSTLFPEERDLLGNIQGKTLAHLMCNAGQDTLSFAQLGASVTGVDISDVAVAAARQLAADTGIPASFVRSDVYAWLAATAASGQSFERVYCGYGAICWLHDLVLWAQGVAAILAPGGRFAVVDFHPTAMMFDRDWNHTQSYYSGGELLPLDGVGDYVAASEGGLTPSGFAIGIEEFANPEPCYLFRWGLGEVVTALAAAGLRIVAVHEYPFANGERQFSRMREVAGRRVVGPEDVPTMPLMYGIAADKR